MSTLISITVRNLRCLRTIQCSRTYAKNVIFRKPISVLNSPNKELILPVSECDFLSKRGGLPSLSATNNSDAPALIKKTEENVVPYKKLDKYDGQFMKMVEIIKNRKKREKSGKILIEGKRLINDAIEAGLKMQCLYFTRECDLHDIRLKDPEDIKICKVLYKTMKIWSDLTTCPGVMGVFKRHTADELNVLSKPTIPVSILCDNIREPGNLGSVIRNAAAAGCQNILLTKGCVDPWDSKVLRTGCGGHFRIPIVNNIEWTQITNYIPSHSTIFVSDNNADIDPVIISSDFISYHEKDEIGEEAQYLTVNEHNQPVRIDESFDLKDEIEMYKDIDLPCHLYSSVEYPQDHIVLYIGGETHGVDPRIVKLACDYGGKKIKIPLENGMDSLNSAFAMTVVLYEIKRQYSQLYVTK